MKNLFFISILFLVVVFSGCMAGGMYIPANERMYLDNGYHYHPGFYYENPFDGYCYYPSGYYRRNVFSTSTGVQYYEYIPAGSNKSLPSYTRSRSTQEGERYTASSERTKQNSSFYRNETMNQGRNTTGQIQRGSASSGRNTTGQIQRGSASSTGRNTMGSSTRGSMQQGRNTGRNSRR